MRRIKFNLASTRLAFVLIACLLLLIIVSAVIPQSDIAEDQILDWREALGERYDLIERLGLDRIYFEPPLFIVLGLLAVNLVAGNLRRFRAVLRREKTLFKTRQLGSILFHFSLLVILVGVILNFLYKSHGVYGLTEGQTAYDSPEQYFRVFDGPLARRVGKHFELTLDTVHQDNSPLGTGDESAEILLSAAKSGETISATVSVGRPLVWEGLEFHLGRQVGYSPELLVTDGAGHRRFRSFIRLAVRQDEGLTTHEDFVILPDGETRVWITLRPGGETAATLEQSLVIERRGEILYEGMSAPDDTVTVGDLRVSLPRLRRWCYIEVLRNPFITMIFCGFWACLAGLALSLFSRVTQTGRLAA